MIGASLLSLSGNVYYKPCSFFFYSFLFAHTDESVIYPCNLLAFDGDGFEVVVGSGEAFYFSAVGFGFLIVLLLVDSVLFLSIIFGSAVVLFAMDPPFMVDGY